MCRKERYTSRGSPRSFAQERLALRKGRLLRITLNCTTIRLPAGLTFD